MNKRRRYKAKRQRAFMRWSLHRAQSMLRFREKCFALAFPHFAFPPFVAPTGPDPNEPDDPPIVVIDHE